MAHGLVIVSTRHGFITELLDETSAYFLDAGSADAVAKLLIDIDLHRDEARRRAQNARAVVQERFTEAKVLGRLRELYLAVLSRQSGARQG
jgi:glycosyltransferase involved in cell wall biosynthesis